jgi:hypothetical protein
MSRCPDVRCITSLLTDDRRDDEEEGEEEGLGEASPVGEEEEDEASAVESRDGGEELGCGAPGR